MKFNEYSTTYHVVPVEGRRVKSGEDEDFLWKIWTNGMETKNKAETVNDNTHKIYLTCSIAVINIYKNKTI